MKPLGAPPLAYVITTGEADPANYDSQKLKILTTIREAIADGVGLIQIREKSLPARLLLDLVSAVVDIRDKTDAVIVVNDRADVAIAAGADGVHLPANSIPVREVRRMFGDRLLIGISTHTLDEAEAAAECGADYILFGPVFESPGKGEPVGIPALERVCNTVAEAPVIALGGIDAANYRQALQAGAAGIAAIRALNDKESRSLIMGGLSAADVR